MGLGKTVQTIAFICWLKCQNDAQKLEASEPSKGSETVKGVDLNSTCGLPHLVIAPSSVLSNWEREFEVFAPHLKVLKYHGSQSERLEIQEELRMHLPGKRNGRTLRGIPPIDVILAPFTYFEKEKSDDRSFLRKFRYDYMVVDEAHLLKNAKGRRYKSLDRFATMHRLLLTGTPVQNTPQVSRCEWLGAVASNIGILTMQPRYRS
jgi:SNF2 family DNA or RNA helicase